LGVNESFSNVKQEIKFIQDVSDSVSISLKYVMEG